MKLVDDAKDFYRWISVQCMAAATALQVAWANTPPKLQEKIPDDWVLYGTVALLILGFFGRLVAQPKKDAK